MKDLRCQEPAKAPIPPVTAPTNLLFFSISPFFTRYRWPYQPKDHLVAVISNLSTFSPRFRDKSRINGRLAGTGKVKLCAWPHFVFKWIFDSTLALQMLEKGSTKDRGLFVQHTSHPARKDSSSRRGGNCAGRSRT